MPPEGTTTPYPSSPGGGAVDAGDDASMWDSGAPTQGPMQMNDGGSHMHPMQH